MAKTRKQTRAELIEHLREQVGYLDKSAAAYDAGDESEAKRLGRGAMSPAGAARE
jgi:hypothetical protein